MIQNFFYRLSFRMKLMLIMCVIMVVAGAALSTQISRLTSMNKALSEEHSVALNHANIESDLRMSLKELVHNSMGLLGESLLFYDAQPKILDYVNGGENIRPFQDLSKAWQEGFHDGSAVFNEDQLKQQQALLEKINADMTAFLKAVNDVVAYIEDLDEDDFEASEINSPVSQMSYLGLSLESSFMSMRQINAEQQKLSLQKEKDMQDALSTGMALTFLFCIVFSCGTVFWIATLLVRPLGRLSDLMADFLKTGRLDQRFETRLEDEVGQLGDSFNNFLDKLHNIILEISKSAHTLNDSASRLSEVSLQMEDSVTVSAKGTTSVGKATRDLHSAMLSTGTASSQVHQYVQDLRDTTQQMNDQIKSVYEQAGMADQTASKAVDAIRGSEEKITRLKQSIHDIRDFTDVITDISKHTNLLALNATIEAARSGHAGAGFAVVASEIKQLAHQTNTATEDIIKRIQTIISNMDVLELNMGQALEIIDNTQNKVSSVTRSVTEQKTGIENISKNTALVASDMETVNKNVKQGVELIQSISEEVGDLEAQNTGLEQGCFAVKDRASNLSERSQVLRQLTDQYQLET